VGGVQAGQNVGQFTAQAQAGGQIQAALVQNAFEGVAGDVFQDHDWPSILDAGDGEGLLEFGRFQHLVLDTSDNAGEPPCAASIDCARLIFTSACLSAAVSLMSFMKSEYASH
jgi:hypothetical protein